MPTLMPTQMKNIPTQSINKQAVAESFSKAAKHYDHFAQLQRDVGDQLLNMVIKDESHSFAINDIVDLGCGTGYFTEKLSSHFCHSNITCFDLSATMLDQVKKRHINNVTFQQGDIDNLPFHENSLDLIYSNLVVQWSDNLEVCLQQVHKSLKAEGRCYFSTLLNGTLDELTQAWKQVDQNPHTNSFLSLKHIKETLAKVPFSQVNITTERRVLYYENVIEVMRALKGVGANHVHGHHSLQRLGRQILKQLQAGYQPFIDEQGRLKLTYQVCYIEATK
ncbi:malonyl-ACP O-methyltransferase BioC [Psychromonas sp. KJ10-10]|uniref:malonyl-ACP O-methyltransferase BioC n=1 Tax=Psychromonas sp. KJ10-10 TaxID=3391823 RepID=UPI0039B5E8A4